MPGITTPPVIIEPFGLHADPANITLPIPVTAPGVAGQAYYDVGFPPETMIAEVAGGVPPFGQDMNGILYTITASLAALQAGQPWLYSAAIVAAIGGYPVGTMLGMADGSGLWVNTVAANVTDPDGGAPGGWVSLYSYGYTGVVGLTNSNVTLTPEQAKKPFVFLNGALTANVQIIFPPIWQSWLVVNACTGGFTVTARTAGGSGVVIPAGGAGAPTGVYFDGGNLQPTVSPLAVPIAIAPTPSTLVERDNSGYVYATYLNQNSGSAENPGVGSIFVENTSGDGFLRKVTAASFIGQLSLATTTAVATAIASALASYSTTAAMTTAIAAAVGPKANSANPTLTGTVGVPTRTPGDSTANAASTAFVMAALVANGYRVKAGSFNCANGTVNVNFAAAFPNACVAVVVQWEYAAPDVGHVVPGSRTAAGFQYANGNAGACTYIAAGN